MNINLFKTTFNQLVYLDTKNIDTAIIYEIINELMGDETVLKIKKQHLLDYLLINNIRYFRALSLICNMYNSQQDYINEIDKFKGKIFCSVYDKKEKITIFIKNKENEKKYILNLLERAKKIPNIDKRLNIKNLVVDNNEVLKSDNVISYKKGQNLYVFNVSPFIYQNYDLKQAFIDFILCRRKKNITQEIINDYIEELRRLSNNDEKVAIEICKRSAKYNWNDLFELDNGKKFKGSNGGEVQGKTWLNYKELSQLKKQQKKAKQKQEEEEKTRQELIAKYYTRVLDEE